MSAAKHEALKESSRTDSRNRLFHFISELRRRRVCRAVTMYSVTLWLVCQIVDVITPALELPEWTLKLVIVLGLLGLPVIILMSWLFEITPDGLVIEGPSEAHQARAPASGPKHIADRLIDCSLILAALAIGVQLGLVALGPPIEAAEPDSQRISVAPFRPVTGEDAASVSDGIVIDLQHVLVGQQGLTVIDTNDPRQLKGSKRLTGTVSTSAKSVRIAVTMTDFDSSVVVWSTIVERPRGMMLAATADLAREIAATLPVPGELMTPDKVLYAAK
jgi:TolB-like protein